MSKPPANNMRERFVDGMRLIASGVNVVTTAGDSGRAGVTVSAMTPVSADGKAPTLLVCIHHQSPAVVMIINNRRFCVNILSDEQSHISDTFAGRRTALSGEDKFSCTEWETMAGGGLRVRHALTAFDCRLLSGEQVGTHYVLIGEVEDVYTAASGRPLIYTNRAYGASVTLRQAEAAASAATLRLGVLHTFGPYLLPALLGKLQHAHPIGDIDLYEGDQRYLLEMLNQGAIDAAFLYDMQLEDNIHAEAIAAFPPYVLLAPAHELAACESLTLRQLLPYPLVLLDAPPSGDYFLSLFADVGTPHVAYRGRSFEMVRGMVANGLGYSILATKTAAAISYDGKPLAMRPLADELPASVLALCRRQPDSNPAITALHQLCLTQAPLFNTDSPVKG